ncbi:MAG: response regulator transcription factor [Neobacillus sp.]
MKILIVDDEMEMRLLLRLYLLQENYLVDEAENGREALSKVAKGRYDLMLLDVMMPEMDGWETIDQVRKISDIPVIMLTAKGSLMDKVTGLSRGADDYLVKPFEVEELLARIQAIIRRSQPNEISDQILKYKGILLNLSARSAMYLDKKINLTQTEFDLLEVFFKHKGKVLSREQLVEIVWGLEFAGEDRTVDSHIRNLRDKLKFAGIEWPLIKTVWGIGYKVE